MWGQVVGLGEHPEGPAAAAGSERGALWSNATAGQSARCGRTWASAPAAREKKGSLAGLVMGTAATPGGAEHASLMALAEDFEVPPGENIVVRELGRDSHVSHHMVAVRDREAPHRHDHSAMTVVVLKGRGRMMIEGEERPIGAGSIIYVPPATVHAYINAKGGALAIAYVMFSPPLRAGDRAPPTAPLPSAAVH